MQIEGLFSIHGDLSGWTSVELVGADHLMVEEKENEKLVDDAELGGCCVVGVSVVDVDEESESICVLLALAAVILRWAETDEGSIVGQDGDASVAVVEERRDGESCCLGSEDGCISDV